MTTATHWPVYVGWSEREVTSYTVAVASLQAHTSPETATVFPISRHALEPRRVYWRPTTTLPSGQLFDIVSDAPMSTDHAIARFFVPWLRNYDGWALFTDGDVLVRDDIQHLCALADPACALQVVQHPPQHAVALKKGGQIQQAYPYKNWSSVMLWNCSHPANRRLTPDVLNNWPGRDLHAFRWLTRDDIGAISPRWNWLVGESAPCDNPAIVHYTLGTPDVPGHEDDPYADEWRTYARQPFASRQEIPT